MSDVNTPVIVSSVTALAGLIDVKVAMVLGYHEGSNKGGGIFIHQPTGRGLRVGEWILQPGQVVTPYHTGALDGSWMQDSYEGLQAFFNFLALPDCREYTAQGVGSFGTSKPLVAEGLGYTYHFDLTVQALEGMDDVITAKACRDSIWTGRIKIKVSQDSWLQRRKGVNGFRIEDSRGAQFCDIEAFQGSGWAVYFAAGNNNMSQVGNVAAQDMGASTRSNQEHKVTPVAFSNYERNTLWQTTTITLSDTSKIPSAAHQMHRAFWISAAGEPYKIRSVNRTNNTITVYPMVPDAEQVMEPTDLVYGGGVCNYSGGHTAKGRFGHVYPMRCGIGIWNSGQSSANVDGLTGQSNAIDIVMGSDPENVFGGSFFGSVYFEWSRIADVIFMSETNSQYSYGSIFGSCTNLDFTKWFGMRYKRRDTPAGSNRRQDFPVTFMNGGKLVTPAGDESVPSDATSYTVSSSSQAPYLGRPLRNNTGIHLVHARSVSKFRGVTPAVFHLYGQRGSNGSYHLPIPVTAQAGYTINGKEGPLVVPNMNVPITLYAFLETDKLNWVVTYTAHSLVPAA